MFLTEARDLEYRSLTEVFVVTDGAGHDPGNQWPRNKNWPTQAKRGHWECVTEHEPDAGSNGSKGRLVKGLDLANNNVKGMLPHENMLCLRNLESVSLEGNPDLSGTLPESFVWMMAVGKHVSFDAGAFSLPHTLHSLSADANLVRLDLSGKGMAGELKVFEDLRFLKYVTDDPTLPPTHRPTNPPTHPPTDPPTRRSTPGIWTSVATT